MFITRKHTAIALVLFSGIANAQTIPNGANVPAAATQAVNPLPSAYSNTIKVNFVRTWNAMVPYTNEADVTSTARTTAEVKQATQYLDGLGRPLQAVAKEASPSSMDIVSMSVYDEFGREQYKYLPYVATTTNGSFHLDPFTEQASYLKSVYNPTNHANGEKFFYSKTVFEASPLNRPIKTFAQGNSWAGSEGSVNEHAVSMGYQINEANETRLWNITATIGSTPTSSACYNAGELYRNITTDERGKRVLEYKDKEGQVILKKVEIVAGASITSHTDWLCTYYVYDDFGLLRFVIPPLATEKLAANGWDFSVPALAGAVNELCFRYEYDARHKMVIKKVPGAGEVHMVYDFRDRLVMTQDAKLRSNDQWIVTQYDALNRPVKTLLWNDVDIRADHQQWVYDDQLIVYPNPSNIGSAEMLTQTYYDDYTWASGISGISSSLDNMFTSSSDYISSYNTSPLYAQQVIKSTETKGMVTGSKTRVLGSSSFLYSLVLYDDKGRSIQTQATTHTGGTEIITMQYDFSGKVLRTHQKHQVSGSSPVIRVLSQMEYDDGGRLTTLKKKINDEALKKISENEYDELGQLKTKKLGTKPTNTSEPLEILDYTYNIRGWLNGINKDYANPADPNNIPERWFGMELGYDHGFTENQFNGNIAGTIWKSRGSDKQRAYGFAYDNANRLLKGDFTQNEGTNTWNQSSGIIYDMKMGTGLNDGSAYDANGNIQRMHQWGLKLATSSQIDNLTYTYTNNSNKLLAVTEQSLGTTNNKLGDFTDKNTALDDYNYDVNGNLNLDKNKDISSITYNYLNLPQVITVTGKGSITYTYDAAGSKLKKVTVDNTVSPSKTTTTDYVSGFVYENNTLQFMPHEEGRIREAKDASGNSTGAFVFDYMIKDHLGNVRTVLTEEEKQDTYHAGFEESQQSFEMQLFNWYKNIVAKPECFDEDGENTKVQVVGAARDAERPMVVGAGKVLKVMAGDHVSAQVQGWFSQNISNADDPSLLEPLLGTLLTLFGQGISSSGAEPAGFSTGNGTVPSGGIVDFLNTQGNYDTNEGAYLNWMLLDEEQLKPVAGGSGFVSLMQQMDGSSCQPKTLLEANNGDGIDIKRNGYLYIYLSNTNKHYPVYFDDLHVVHTRSSLMEETHYYPFGLTMSGISSKAANSTPNKIKFGGKELQTKEFSDGSGLESYDFGARHYDQQIGRWFTVDPKSETSRRWSVYNYAYNNPLRFIDPDGMQAKDWVEYRDEDGNLQVTWINSVKSAKGAKTWAATANANGSNITDVAYIGTTGIVNRGFETYGEESRPYQLNADGSATRMADGKPTTTKKDAANTEPSEGEKGGSGVEGGQDGGTGIKEIKEYVDEFTSTVAQPGVATGVLLSEKVAPPDAPTSAVGKSIVGAVGKALGVYDAASAIYDAYQKPTVGNILKAGLKTGLAAFEVFGKVNPVLGLVTALADATGFTNWIFSKF